MENLLTSVSGKSLTLDERKILSIELASQIIAAADKEASRREKRRMSELARMMHDPIGKAFTMMMTDECFRSNDLKRVAAQMLYLLDHFGVPTFLSRFKRLGLHLFRSFGATFPQLLAALAKRFLRKETKHVIIPGEKRALSRHIRKRRAEGVRLNINHLGEAILGEEEARRRLHIYLADLNRPNIEYVSIKISTIYSQINLLAYDETIEELAKRLRELYQAALPNKFVNLDMEEYRDLHLTKDLFMKVLSEPEFLSLSAGIVLQAYLPDSFAILKELTTWAQKRVASGGAPIKVRIVKGANMAMERVEASVRGWPQAPYTTKVETDANYKRMVTYACEPAHARAIHVGIASHNVFDIAYALILRSEHRTHEEVSFEMLEGMADPMRRVVQKLAGGILLYCAVATKRDFQSAIAYLVRRLDENTGAENFLAHSFGLTVGSPAWDAQVALFSDACAKMSHVSEEPRRKQARISHSHEKDGQSKPHLAMDAPFDNEPDTDFSLEANRVWARSLHITRQETIPAVIGGEAITRVDGDGYDPSNPDKPLYRYTLATAEEIDRALQVAKGGVSPEMIASAAQMLRKKRGELIGAMVADGAKIIAEADIEVSEAIDFCEYYLRSYISLTALADISWKPKGTVLVTPPWNFPVAIPTGGIIAALVTGNAVLFKPASESVLAGWVLVNALWEAGIPRTALQFIPCASDPVGTQLIKDSRVNAVILTGATATARHFLKLRPGLDLSAETGGKNAMIITALADRDLAIKELVRSAFGHNGQKCSAASLAVLEAEVYDDPHFRSQLCDAVASLHVGSQWNPSSTITPLIRSPGKELHKALTTLEEGESWLLQPKRLKGNLWTPGIKLNAHKGSYTHQTEFFGPVLALMRAENIYDAIRIANGTPYGLTSSIQSLDVREQILWEKAIVAGNCYINRGTTGAVVRRQPFGGCKNSVYGHGSKAGGPNYLTQFMHAEQIGIPKEKHSIGFWVNNLSSVLEKIALSAEELGLWYASISSYAFWWNRFSKGSDTSKLIGQDNILKYRPHKKVAFRIGPNDKPIDYIRVIAAALTCEASLSLSWDTSGEEINWQAQLPIFSVTYESEEEFIQRMHPEKIKRLRMLQTPSPAMLQKAAENGCYIDSSPVLANGRIELLHYLREVAISTDYHRYGNLGLREHEIRKPVV